MTRSMMALGLLVGVGACEPPPAVARPEPPPERTGSLMLLDLRPRNGPSLDGSVGFELLDQIVGKTCVKRGDATTYWFGFGDLSRVGPDPLTHQAVAAAAFDAISNIQDADSFILTYVLAQAKGPDKICAEVHGRAVRLVKGGDAKEEEHK